MISAYDTYTLNRRDYGIGLLLGIPFLLGYLFLLQYMSPANILLLYAGMCGVFFAFYNPIYTQFDLQSTGSRPGE